MHSTFRIVSGGTLTGSNIDNIYGGYFANNLNSLNHTDTENHQQYRSWSHPLESPSIQTHSEEIFPYDCQWVCIVIILVMLVLLALLL
ncbi:hypothetical protein BT96DRAFT_1003756 [Gymnopus androsaceus JB14]|uniref:Uncharacterized protein n=1 Tax=Gymnopus androsaceus JB14 TaxID=1447944 RepID=A0A6A4GU29_9AGAR|nr:hypothetical protein BT96DRAFT_1003756 [Gymnopus androsaceus JB14]